LVEQSSSDSDMLIDLTNSDDEGLPVAAPYAPMPAARPTPVHDDELGSDIELLEPQAQAAPAEDIELGEDEDLVVTGDKGDVRAGARWLASS
jgi:hypothetical protein